MLKRKKGKAHREKSTWEKKDLSHALHSVKPPTLTSYDWNTSKPIFKS